jgi:hypothetical protein
MRIKDLPEATELAEDDYLVLASEGGGACKILAKKFEPVLLRINAVYTQTETVYDDTPLDDLKTDLVVTAYYQGGGSRVVDNYTLSGTLEVGSSTVTVSYKSKTDTITVEVSSRFNYAYQWDLTQSLTDKVKGITATLADGAVFTQGTGVNVNGGAGLLRVVFDTPILFGDYIFEIDFANTNYNTDSNGTIFKINRSEYRYSTGIRWFANTVWTTVINGTAGGQTIQCNDANIFSGKTMKFLNENNSLQIFANNSLVSENTKFCDNNKSINDFEVGSGYYNFTITGIRIYENQ